MSSTARPQRTLQVPRRLGTPSMQLDPNLPASLALQELQEGPSAVDGDGSDWEQEQQQQRQPIMHGNALFGLSPGSPAGRPAALPCLAPRPGTAPADADVPQLLWTIQQQLERLERVEHPQPRRVMPSPISAEVVLLQQELAVAEEEKRQLLVQLTAAQERRKQELGQHQGAVGAAAAASAPAAAAAAAAAARQRDQEGPRLASDEDLIARQLAAMQYATADVGTHDLTHRTVARRAADAAAKATQQRETAAAARRTAPLAPGEPGRLDGGWAGVLGGASNAPAGQQQQLARLQDRIESLGRGSRWGLSRGVYGVGPASPAHSLLPSELCGPALGAVHRGQAAAVRRPLRGDSAGHGWEAGH